MMFGQTPAHFDQTLVLFGQTSIYFAQTAGCLIKQQRFLIKIHALSHGYDVVMKETGPAKGSWHSERNNVHIATETFLFVCCII